MILKQGHFCRKISMLKNFRPAFSTIFVVSLAGGVSASANPIWNGKELSIELLDDHPVALDDSIQVCATLTNRYGATIITSSNLSFNNLGSLSYRVFDEKRESIRETESILIIRFFQEYLMNGSAINRFYISMADWRVTS